MKQKVLAYIIRERNHLTELLIHEHRGFPEAGLQVPAGTVEDNESLEHALLREIKEESGLTDVDVKLVKKLDQYVYHNHQRDEDQERSVFVLQAGADTLDSWDHTITGNGEDHGLVFCYSWHPINSLPELSGSQDRSIRFLQLYLEH